MKDLCKGKSDRDDGGNNYYSGLKYLRGLNDNICKLVGIIYTNPGRFKLLSGEEETPISGIQGYSIFRLKLSM